MKQLSIVSAVVLTTSSLFSQGTVYSPPWTASSEGSLYSYIGLGYYTDGRYQMADGHVQSPAVLKSVAMRLDNRSYYSSVGAGRTWANVTITMGKTSIANFTSTFSNNRGGSETLVFSGSVTWPEMSGYPLTTPDIWGGATGAYRFPFSTNYVHAGGDLLSEFEFTGGTLANNGTWATTTAKSYYFDSYGSPTGSVGGSGRYIPATRLNNNSTGVTGRCNDSVFGTTTSGAYTFATGSAYGSLYYPTNYRNQLLFYSYSYYTGYDAPVIHAYGFGANDTGVDIFNTGCNKMHFNSLVAINPMRSLPKAVSTSGYSGYRYIFVPWNNNLIGAKIVAQAYWTDSVTGKPNLAQAYEWTAPMAAPESQLADRYAAYSSSKTATTGTISAASSYNPAVAYGQ